MFAQERSNVIRKIVRTHRRMTFAQLQQLVKVSPATLRRDLAELELAGDVIRVHGGVLDPCYVRTEVSFDERVVLNSPAKKSIAATAALLVPAGATVLIDAGTTCLELGKALLGRKDVTIITHSVALVLAAFRGEATVLCLGGELRKVSGALIGGGALGALKLIHADVAFIGASGLDPAEGCSTTELFEAELKTNMISRAARKVLLADHTKWKNPSTIHFANWSDFTDWVTDEIIEPEKTRQLCAGGLKIHEA
ncbi:MAG TPA: DeoR/GlpR family DNA-binding transcription regulator [Verrucomicrobiae bacterium]|nr:DeoR/GlpR family DNA-binding transcription regulator [Verrucomicrobiae bacterium]